jgi:AraC family transcriptional regulator
MDPVQQVVWLVETQMGSNPSVQRLSRETGLSRFVISRLFADATGKTVAAYLRGRRLTQAAKLLVDSEMTVLRIADAIGYGSHEAFTRAFRREFGATPEAIRRSRDIASMMLTEPIRMTAPQQVPLASPEIAQMPPSRFVGLTRTYDVSGLGGIPDQWQHFVSHIAHLDPKRVGGAYGIVRNAAPNGEKVAYSCAIREGLVLDEGGEIATITVPAMRLAKFTHRGHISAIRASTMSIFAHELPQLGLIPRGPIDLIEYYGPGFDPHTGFGEIGLWINIGS